MAKPATSMDIPTDAVTYLTDDPSRAIEAGKKYGIEILSPGEARQALPHFGGLGARPNLSLGHWLDCAMDNAAVGTNLISFN
jgi:hypothetical protein